MKKQTVNSYSCGSVLDYTHTQNTHDNTSLFTSPDITKFSDQLLFPLWRILLSFTNLRHMYKHISPSISTWQQLFRDELETTKHKRYTKACAVALARSRRPLTWHSWWKRWHRVRFSSDYFGFLLSVSFHRCATLIHSPVTDAVWLQQLTASSINTKSTETSVLPWKHLVPCQVPQINLRSAGFCVDQV